MQDIQITADMSREAMIKLFKLSEKMVDAIIEDRFLAAPTTEKALETRGIVGDRRSHVKAHLTGSCQVCAAPSDETNELPGDAERALQADEDAATYAEILAEQDVEDLAEQDVDDEAGITRLIKSLDAYVMTDKKIFVSKDRYLATMARIRAYRADRRAAWLNMQAITRDMFTRHDWFAEVDASVALGEVSFRAGDRHKRIIRQIARPSVGPKRKPSKASKASKASKRR